MMKYAEHVRNWSKRKKLTVGIISLISIHIVIIIAYSFLASVFGSLATSAVERDERNTTDGHYLICLSTSLPSPDGKHSMLLYTNEGAPSSVITDAATVVITANDSGKMRNNKESWCLFSSWYDRDIQCEWIDDETVKIYRGDENRMKYCLTLNIYQDELTKR